MKVVAKISDLISDMDGKYISALEPSPLENLAPSEDRIQALARSKIMSASSKSNGHELNNSQIPSVAPEGGNEGLREYGLHPFAEANGNSGKQSKKRFRMKRKSIIILVAVIACMLSVTALAAGLGGLKIFQSIFGDSAKDVEEYIVNPHLVAEQGEYTLCVESMLSDGYKTNIVVSLRNAGGQDTGEMPAFHVTDEKGTMHGWVSTELQAFVKEDKRYYSIVADSVGGFQNSALTISLESLQLSITVKPEEGLGSKLVQTDAAYYADAGFQPQTIRLSPMGFLITGIEKEPAGGISAPAVFLVYSNGKKELLVNDEYFDQNAEGSTGGGGAVFSGPFEQRRLAEEVHGTRNARGEVVITGQFTRILNLNDVRAMVVDGVEYSVE